MLISLILRMLDLTFHSIMAVWSFGCAKIGGAYHLNSNAVNWLRDYSYSRALTDN